jgi:signal transduction histidine kinase
MIRLRWLGSGVLLLSPLLAPLFGLLLPAGIYFTLGTILAAYNALLYLSIRNREAHLETAVSLQIALDLLMLTVVLHFAGGIENPLVSVYSFHVILSAVVLSRRASFWSAGTGLLLIALLAAGGGPRPVPRLLLVLAHGAFLLTVAYLSSVVGGVLRHREQELVRLNRSLAGEERRKSQYVLMLAHSVFSRVEDIERALPAALAALPEPIPDAARGMFRRIEGWIGGLHGLLENVLRLSRIRAAGEMEMSYVYLPRIVSQQVQELGPLAREKNIELSVSLPEHVPPIRGNAPALSQAVENLLRNAISYSPADSTVRVTLVEETDRLALSVEDQGIGIPPEDLPHVFDEFYRGEAARRSEERGTGLGLAVVKYVMSLHGGEVEVEPKPGPGCRFRVTLPAIPGLS